MEKKDIDFIFDTLVNHPEKWMPWEGKDPAEYYVLTLDKKLIRQWRRLDEEGYPNTSIMQFAKDYGISITTEYTYEADDNTIWLPMKYDHEEIGGVKFLGDKIRIKISKEDLLSLTAPIRNPEIVKHRLPILTEKIQKLYWQRLPEGDTYTQFALISSEHGQEIFEHQRSLRDFIGSSSLRITRERKGDTTTYKVFLNEKDADYLGVKLGEARGPGK